MCEKKEFEKLNKQKSKYKYKHSLQIDDELLVNFVIRFNPKQKQDNFLNIL